MTSHRYTLFALLFATASAHAGDAKAAISSEPAKEPSRWRFGAAYAPIFGLETKFSGLGAFTSPFAAQPIAPGTNYQYEDGYVRVDSSGNVGGETWNWGYQNNAQYDAGSNSIAMSLTSSSGNASARENDDVAQGVDLFAYYDMGKVGIPGLAERGATWGFRGGLHYGRVDMENRDTLRTGTTVVQDTFAVVSGVAPLAPYNGTFGGPGPRLNDTPIRDIVTGTALVAGTRDLDVYLTTFSLGSYLDIPVVPKFHVLLEGGLSAAVASGDYDFETTVTTPSGPIRSSGSDSDTKVLPGCYLGVSATYQFNEAWALQLSGRYQYMDSFSLKDNGSEAKLSFDSAYIVSLGVLYTF